MKKRKSNWVKGNKMAKEKKKIPTEKRSPNSYEITDQRKRRKRKKEKKRKIKKKISKNKEQKENTKMKH